MPLLAPLDCLDTHMSVFSQLRQTKTGLAIILSTLAAFSIDMFVFNGYTIFWLAALSIGCIVALLAPSSHFWQVGFKDNLKAVIVIGCVLVVVFCIIALNQSQFETYDAYAQLEYDRLAQAFLSGHVYLDEVPSDGLMALDNPYDYYERQASGVDLLWDYAYFQGRYYVYFGALPCLLFFLPFRAVTGAALPVVVSIYLTIAMLVNGMVYLTWQLGKRYFPKASLGLFLIVLIAQLTASWCFFLPSVPNTYTLPVALGLVSLVWGIGLWMSAMQTARIHKLKALAGSLAMAAAIASRPQMLIGLLIVVLLLVFHAREHGVKTIIAPMIILIACSFAIFALQGWYNYVRFGNPLDFGATYNLTTNDMRVRGFDIEKTPWALIGFLFQPPTVSGEFPFFHGWLPEARDFGYLFSEPILGGLIAWTPLTWLCILPVFQVVRGKFSSERACLFVLCAVSCAVIILFDANVAGVLSRYFMDFGIFIAMMTSLAIGIGFEDADVTEMVEKQAFLHRRFTLAGTILIASTTVTLILQVPIVALVV